MGESQSWDAVSLISPVKTKPIVLPNPFLSAIALAGTVLFWQ